MAMPVAPAFDQDAYRARTSVTDPSGVDAAFDAGDVAANTAWTQEVGDLFRVRFVIQQTVSTYVNHNNGQTEFRLQYRVNTGGGFGSWTAMPAQAAASVPIRFANSTGFADGDNTTTQRLGSGTLVTGDGLEVQDSDTITFTEEALTEAELEVALELVTGEVADEDIFELRWLYSDNNAAPPATILEAYTNTPSITANVTPPPATLPPGLGPDVGEFADVAQSASVAVLGSF